jgi:hypothetical protein
MTLKILKLMIKSVICVWSQRYVLMKVSISNIGYRTTKFRKVSEYRYRIHVLKYRNIGYRIPKKVSGAQLWKIH